MPARGTIAWRQAADLVGSESMGRMEVDAKVFTVFLFCPAAFMMGLNYRGVGHGEALPVTIVVGTIARRLTESFWTGSFTQGRGR